MRQPVSRAARRAFWPSLPIASESWKSGTMTRAERAASSTTITSETRAGLSALPTRVAGLVGPVDDVDLLAVQLVHHVAHPLAHRADARALGVHAGHVGHHRDLGAVTGLAGDAVDLDGAVGDLGDLEGEQLLDQVGVGAREHHLRAAHALADADHQALDPGAVGVVLTGHPLPRRQQRLELAEVDHHVVGVAALLDQPGDDVALLAGELTELPLVLGVAQALQHDLLRGRGGDPAEALGGVVVLPDDVALLVVLLAPSR